MGSITQLQDGNNIINQPWKGLANRLGTLGTLVNPLQSLESEAPTFFKGSGNWLGT